MSSSYPFASIEQKWQQYWEKNQTFAVDKTPSAKPKYYVLDMFPYPSSSGLHVGHVEGYTASDILARYKRTRGFQVLHPMGWDAFGLPAEQYALQTGVHPAITTKKAIANFTAQLKRLGLSYDWSAEISTCDPSYYKWTQFIFTKLYEKGLAYQKEVPVNWCPGLKTVLANEEVVDGKSERGGHPVYRVPMRQWMLKITAYAERLLKDLDKLDWPESTKDAQRNWIGRSEGLLLKFKVASGSRASAEQTVEVFTTRPDTLWGVTFVVLAPEHPLVKVLTTPDQTKAVEEYQKQTAQKSEISRQEQTKDKTGVFTGAFVLHPETKEKVPVWISDYVLMGYGTGAVMAVPGHDERDEAFATSYDLPIKSVIQNPDGLSVGYKGELSQAKLVNSSFATGLSPKDAQKKISAWAKDNCVGEPQVQYKLRDWLFSRQRYWGEPIPVLHTTDEKGNAAKKTVNLKYLPVELPAVESYEPTGTGESPLAAVTEWVDFVDPETGAPSKRETDTMPGSAGSSWYFLRYIDPRNVDQPFDKDREKYWLPVDLYLGGPEHAVGHLLYSRFWMKFLFDIGLVSHDEPFQKLVHQGMILGEDGEKMSKSRGNVVSPDTVIDAFGTDSLRLYEMFMGPLDKEKPWSTSAIDGVHRFLNRVWRIYSERDAKAASGTPSVETLRLFHKTIRKVTENIEQLRFNTAISQMMIFVNQLTKAQETSVEILKPFAQLLAPFAPHFGEELWQMLGEKDSLAFAPWPEYDAALAKDEIVTVAVQVLGKTRGTVEVEPGSSQEIVEAQAKSSEGIAKYLEGKTIRKVIYVQDRILNFVVG